jgi:hypothetical protein
MNWSKLLLQVGYYKIEKVKQVVTKSEIVELYHLGEIPFFRHNPKGTLKRFCKKHHITWKYTRKMWFQEELYKRVITLQEVEAKVGKKWKDS